MPNTYVALKTTTVPTDTASVTLDLTGITGYTDLVIAIASTGSTIDSSYAIQFNNDTTSGLYSDTYMYGNPPSAVSGRHSNQNQINAMGRIGTVVSTSLFSINNFSSTTVHKTVISKGGSANNILITGVGLWRNTAAITSIKLFSESVQNILAGSTFNVYGIANADLGAAKATGGIITEDATYWYHTFGASGTFTPKQSLSCDFLVVAGGGGGCTNATSGGGGAGGLLTLTSIGVTAIPYNVAVGAGGATAGAPGGITGNDSQFGALTLVKGGGGGGATNTAGKTGGSGGGGGGGSSAGAGGAPNSGQGFAGGAGYAPGSDQQGGGGGGAGAVGQAGLGAGSGFPQSGGNGGIGLTNSLINTIGSATGVGQLVSGNYYLAGGGGAHFAGAGGLGGGGGGATAGTALSGTPNTGGGGKGGGSSLFGAGGSGVVIVRYAK